MEAVKDFFFLHHRTVHAMPRRELFHIAHRDRKERDCEDKAKAAHKHRRRETQTREDGEDLLQSLRPHAP